MTAVQDARAAVPSQGLAEVAPEPRVLDLPDRAALGADQATADELIDDLVGQTLRELEAGRPNPDLLLHESVAPGVPPWMAMRKLAIALHPMYEAPSLARLGGELTMADLERPLPSGIEPFQELAQLIGAERAGRVRERYAAFLDTAYTDALRTLIQGSRDSRAIRWRAEAAVTLALEVARDWSEPVRLISLACGAAGPVARLADELESHDLRVERMLLVDRDPIALAAGRAIAERHLRPDLVEVFLLDLVDLRTGAAADLAAHLGATSAQVVDMLGLFEYLPDEVAVDLLRRAGELLAPGGVVLLANMLDVRPGQTEFADLVQWPPLVQRSVAELRALARAAGYLDEQVEVVVPSQDDAVYAVARLRP